MITNTKSLTMGGMDIDQQKRLNWFLSNIKQETIEEVINYTENKEIHYRDLARYCKAFVGWVNNSTLDIVYVNSKVQQKQKFLHISFDFSDIDPDGIDTLTEIKSRILNFDWYTWCIENPDSYNIIYEQLKSSIKWKEARRAS